MKKFVFFLLIGISLISFNGCNGNTIPIVQDVCEITTDICNYANLLCSQFVPENLTKQEQDKLKQELLELREVLQAKVQTLNIEANLKKNNKDNITFFMDSLRESIEKINCKIEIAKE